jgi:hypothetical protein
MVTLAREISIHVVARMRDDAAAAPRGTLG